MDPASAAELGAPVRLDGRPVTTPVGQCHANLAAGRRADGPAGPGSVGARRRGGRGCEAAYEASGASSPDEGGMCDPPTEDGGGAPGCRTTHSRPPACRVPCRRCWCSPANARYGPGRLGAAAAGGLASRPRRWTRRGWSSSYIPVHRPAPSPAKRPQPVSTPGVWRCREAVVDDANASGGGRAAQTARVITVPAEST
jgi:hypothetical protein